MLLVEPGRWWVRVLWGTPLLLAVLAILLTPWPPMLDWPFHMAQAALLAHINDSSFIPAGVYCRAPFSSYQLFHIFVAWIYSAVGPDWVSRVSLLALFISYVAVCWHLLKSFGADRALLVLALPLFFGFPYVMGFGPFLLGLICVLLCVSLAQRWSAQEAPGWGGAMLWSGALLLTFFSHPLAFYLALVTLGVRWWMEWVWSATQRWPSFVAMLPPGMLGVWHFVAESGRAASRGTWWKKMIALYPSFHWQKIEHSLLQKLLYFPLFLIGNTNLDWRDALLAWLLLLLLAFGLVVVLRKEGANVLRSSVQRGRWTAAFVAIGFYIGFGKYHGYVNFVYERFALVAFLCLLPLVPFRREERRGQLWLFAGVALCLVLTMTNLFNHLGWNKASARLVRLIRALPLNQRVLVLVTKRRHAAGIVQTYKGGEVHVSFSYVRHMPVRDCQPFRQARTWGFLLHPETFRPKEHPGWDFLLINLKGRRHMLQMYRWLQDKKGRYKPWKQSGEWLLLRRRS